MIRYVFFISLLFFTFCGQRRPSHISTQELPTTKISDTDKSITYGRVLKGGYDLFNEGDSKTQQFLKDALEKDPNSNYLRIRLAYEYAKADDLKKAEELAQETLKDKPNDLDALFLQARIYAVRGDFEQSKTTFLKILDLEPIKEDSDRKLEVSFVLASLYIEKAEYKHAEDLLKEIITENPDHVLSIYYLARVYSETNKMKKALEMYQRTVELDPRFVLAWRAMGLMNEYLKDWTAALAAYQRASEIEPANIEVRTRMIDVYLKLKEPEKAITEIKKIKAMFPTVPDVSVRLGLFYFQEKMFERAEEEFTEGAQKFKNHTDFFYYLGLTQYQLKKLEASLKSLDKVSPSSEMYPQAQVAQASLLEEMGKPLQAEKNLKTALSEKPDSLDLRAGYAAFLVRQKKYDEAEKLLVIGLEKTPTEERLILGLAEIYEKKKNFSKLEALLGDLLTREPNNANALNFLGYSYADRGIELDKAEELIRKALTIKPQDGYILDSLGWVLYKKKQYKKAEPIFQEALRKVPDEPVILEHLADNFAKMGKKQDAIQTYNRALKNSDDEEQKKTIQKKIKDLEVPN